MPASDLIDTLSDGLGERVRVLRDGAAAGSAGRPLSRDHAVWLLEDGYPDAHTQHDDDVCDDLPPAEEYFRDFLSYEDSVRSEEAAPVAEPATAEE